MFRTLKNEAKIDIVLHVETPLAIMAGETNMMDPSRPDNQVVTQWINGRYVPYIPGSSLKGVLRSRAEQLLRGLGVEVDDPFDKYSQSNKPRSDATHVYDSNCPVSQLFGSLSLKGRVTIRDAYPLEPERIILGHRHNVGIDRISGGPKRSALFDREVVESGSFGTMISLNNFELWQLSLMLHLLKDLHDGYIRLGAATTRGLGKVSVEIQTVTIRQYGLLPENPAPIQGAIHEHDRTRQAVHWERDWFSHTFTKGGWDFWIGDHGILNELATAPWLNTR